MGHKLRCLPNRLYDLFGHRSYRFVKYTSLCQKNILRFAVTGLSMFFFLYHPAKSEAQQARPTLLELKAGDSLIPFQSADNRSVYGNDFELSLGLGWMPIRYLTVHARIGASWFYTWNQPLEYHYHNAIESAAHLGSIDVAVRLETHLANRLPALYAECIAKSYFARYRAGIFRILAGIGLTFAPFYDSDRILRTVQFGFGVRMPLVDDFETVFDLQNSPAEWNLHAIWGF